MCSEKISTPFYNVSSDIYIEIFSNQQFIYCCVKPTKSLAS